MINVTLWSKSIFKLNLPYPIFLRPVGQKNSDCFQKSIVDFNDKHLQLVLNFFEQCFHLILCNKFQVCQKEKYGKNIYFSLRLEEIKNKQFISFQFTKNRKKTFFSLVSTVCITYFDYQRKIVIFQIFLLHYYYFILLFCVIFVQF